MVTTRGGIIALVVLVGESVSGMATPLVVTEPAHAQILQDMQRCESKHGVTHNQLFSAGPMLIMLSEDGMDLGSFWKIIEDARSGANDDEVFLRKIDSSLQMLKPEQLVEFESHRVKLDAESYTWRLWGAAYLMTGRCGDDCFDDFRAWLMSQGRKIFENAIKDPDSLAHISKRRIRVREFEEFMSLTRELYEVKTGQEMPDSLFRGVVRPELGARWDFNNNTEMKKRYPKLFAKYRKR